MNQTTKTIAARANDLAAELREAEAKNESAQRAYLFDDSKGPEADEAFAKVESIKRRIAALRGAAEVARDDEEAAASQAKVRARRAVVKAAQPLVEQWHQAACAFAEHMHAIRSKLAAMESAKVEALSAFPSLGGPFTADEKASLRNALSFGRIELPGIGGLVYHSGLGALGAFPEMNRFVGAIDLDELVERQRRSFDSILNALAEGD